MNDDEELHFFYPYEQVTCYMNDNIMIIIRDIKIFIQLLFNPLCEFSNETFMRDIEFSMEGIEDHHYDTFIKDLEKMNEEIKILKDIKHLKQPNFLKEMNRFLQNEENELRNQIPFKVLAHKFVENKMNEKNIKINWIKAEDLSLIDPTYSEDDTYNTSSINNESCMSQIKESNECLKTPEIQISQQGLILKHINKKFFKSKESLNETDEKVIKEEIDSEENFKNEENSKDSNETKKTEEIVASKEEFVQLLSKKSKSKERMVLRERKKLSFIQFFMGKNYKNTRGNTHMKRYQKILDKNRISNNQEEICVICLGKYSFRQ